MNLHNTTEWEQNAAFFLFSFILKEKQNLNLEGGFSLAKFKF